MRKWARCAGALKCNACPQPPASRRQRACQGLLAAASTLSTAGGDGGDGRCEQPTHETSPFCSVVNEQGPRNWTVVAEEFNIRMGRDPSAGRTGKQCRERWIHHLRPDIKRGAWTEEEDRTIVEGHKQHGNKWVAVGWVSQDMQQHDRPPLVGAYVTSPPPLPTMCAPGGET
jgi:hypothetical protein